jgi:tetratricopeptide (TPR) repeat protein
VALTYFLTTRLHLGPIALIRGALARDVQLPVTLRARSLLTLGALIGMIQTGNRPYETARHLCEEVVDLARELDDPSLEADALTRLARFSWYLGQPDVGLAYGERAVEIARQVGDHGLIGRALAAVGFVQPISAARRDSYLDALVHLRQAGDLTWACSALIGLSIGDWSNLEQVRESRALQEEAIAIAEELGSLYHLLVLWTDCGITCYLLGEVEAAQRYSSLALRLNRRRGRTAADSIWSLFPLACCATSNGDFVRAAQLVGAQDVIIAGLPDTDDSNWSPLETEMREANRARLVEVLGDEGFERARTAGSGLTFDRVVDLALGRV